MKKLICFMLIVLLLSSCGVEPVQAYAIALDEETFYTYQDMDLLSAQIADQESRINAANDIIIAAKKLGYSDSSIITVMARREIEQANGMKKDYLEIYNTLKQKWEKKKEEYPEATYVWEYFQDLGYNQFVIAGILGNMMTESGGQTLALQPEIYSADGMYYGVCQWSKKYMPEVHGKPLEEQCIFLKDTIEAAFNVYGGNYKKKFTYEDFLALEDAEDAALAFAKCYERCSSSSYKKRETNAITALHYFITE